MINLSQIKRTLNNLEKLGYAYDIQIHGNNKSSYITVFRDDVALFIIRLSDHCLSSSNTYPSGVMYNRVDKYHLGIREIKKMIENFNRQHYEGLEEIWWHGLDINQEAYFKNFPLIK